MIHNAMVISVMDIHDKVINVIFNTDSSGHLYKNILFQYYFFKKSIKNSK